ncbi:MAG: filamentous hemagglutinin N-terminal domain-containing protein, partial [Vulcanimicrobiota bacterium]
MRRTILTSLLACGLGAAGWSLPQDPSTAHGQVQIQTISPNFMQILQASPQAILNWNQFNIGLGETVRFLQPSTQAAILNRVTGLDPSLIQGTLQANGSVFLLNPNGILFGPNAVVDVGSFMASTLKMSDDDFLSGTYKLTQDRSLPLAAITNQGQIHVADGGFVVLTSPLLDNQGLIVAQSGTVHLGATTQATFSVDGRGQVQFAMPDGFNPQFTGGGQGGTVLLQPGQVSSILTQVVSNPGLVEAGSLSAGANGQTLAAGAEGVLINSGTIQADGGKVRLDSSQATVHTSAGVISARGGEARVLSDGTTLGLGSVDARGGFIEVSAQNLYQVGPLAAATVLIDPDNIQIVNDTNGNGTFDGMLGGLPANGNGTVSTGAIIATANLILTANNDISYVRTGSPDLIGTGTSLSLVAGHDIILDPGNANIELAALSLQANNQINITRAGLIKTYSGPISMTTTTGDILISSAGHLTLASPQTINIDAGNDFSLTLPAGFAFDESSTTMAITAGRNANIRADFVAQSVGNPLTLNAQGDVDLRSNTGSSLQWFLAGLDVQAGGSLTASSSGSLTLGTNPGDLNLVAAGGALSIQSPSTLALSSTQGTTLEGSSVLLDGGGINVQAQAGLTITSTNGNLHVTTSGGGSLVSSADAINMRSTGGEIRYTGPSNLDLRAAGSTDVNSATNLTIQTGNGFTLALDGTPTTLHADRTVDIRTTSITGGNHPVLMTAGENITFNPGPGSSLDFSQTQALTLTASRDLVFNVPNNFLVTTAGDQAFTAGRKLQATVGQTQQLISNTGKIGWQAGEISDDTGNSQDWRGPQGIRLVTSGGESGSSGNITLQDPNASIQLNSTGSDVNVTASHDITFSAASPVTLLSNVGSGTTTVNASNDVNITAGNGQSVTLGGTTARVKSGNDVFITTDGLRGDPAAGTALNLESAHDLSLRPQGTGAALQVQSASINATAVNDLLLDGGSNLFVTTTVGDLRLRGDRNLNLTTTGALQLISAGAMNLQGGNVTTNAGGNTLLQSATGTALTATTGNVSLVTGG